MKLGRAPVVLFATVAGVAAVLGYHPHPQTSASLPPAAVSPQASSGSGGSTGGSSSGTQTVTGDSVPNGYGNVQVRVTASGGEIAQVEAVQLPDGDGQSQSISSFSAPQLAQQALAAQSASIDGVSGATYTSDAYRSSLQSAIDQLGAPSGAVAGGTG